MKIDRPRPESPALGVAGFPKAPSSRFRSLIQAAVAGTYAWAVSVAPSAWGRGSPPLATASAILALACLWGSVPLESRHRAAAQKLALWGLVVGSACTWLAAPESLRAFRVDSVRGVAGVLGWLLFGLAYAGPALVPPTEDHPTMPVDPRKRPHMARPALDAAYVVAASVIAVAVESVGWNISSPERALLVRLVALGAGVAILGAGVELACFRHSVRVARSRRTRFRRSLPWLIALGVLVALGLLRAPTSN